MGIVQNLSVDTTARGIFLLVTKDVISTVTSVVFFVLVARFLPSIADLGVLTGLQTLIIMFVILSGLGLPYASVRFISTYIGSGESKKAYSLYPLTFVIGAASSAAFALILYGISPQISDWLFHGTITTPIIQLASLDIFFYSLMLTCGSLLTASMEFKKLTYITILNSILKYTLSLLLLVLGLQIYGIILGLIIGDAFALFLFVYFLWPKFFENKIRFGQLFELGSLLKYSLSTYGFLVINFLSIRIDVYLLLTLSTLYLVGIYTPAIFVASTFLMILLAMDQALLPIFSRLYGKSGTSSFKYCARCMTRYIFLFYYPLGFALAASSHSIVEITLGERFVESTFPIMIIMIAITLTSPIVIINNLLRSAGHTRMILGSASIGLVIQIFISVIAIPSFGVVGVAVARSISRIVLLIFPLYELRRMGGFEIDRTALKSGISASLLIVFVIISIDLIVTGPFSLLIQYTVAFIVFLTVLRVTRVVNAKDIELMDKVLMGKMKILLDPVKEILIKS